MSTILHGITSQKTVLFNTDTVSSGYVAFCSHTSPPPSPRSDVEECILLIDLCFTEEQVQPEEYSTKDKTEERVNTKVVPAEDKLEEGTAEGSPEGEKGPVEGNPEGTSADDIQDFVQVEEETPDSKESDSSKESGKSRQVLLSMAIL
jgi:hypothetical protein